MTTPRPLGLAPGHVYSDHLQVHPDECVELVAHHLRLAAMFYQSTPEDLIAVNAEVLRILTLKHGEDDPATQAAECWLERLKHYYDNHPVADI